LNRCESEVNRLLVVTVTCTIIDNSCLRGGIVPNLIGFKDLVASCGINEVDLGLLGEESASCEIVRELDGHGRFIFGT
jgi:hypothetical protein